jgi:hypothetical protein
MPNGFHGPKGEWERMEAPYLRIDPILESFAQRHGFELVRNYRDADRSLRFNDSLSRAVWVHSTDRYGTGGTYQVSVVAHQDRDDRYLKAARVADPVVKDDLEQILERAAEILISWSEQDLELPLPPRERGETERIY